MRTEMRFVNPYQARNIYEEQQGLRMLTKNLGMTMTMTGGVPLSARGLRKVIKAPSKIHQGKLYPGKLNSGKRHPGKIISGKLSHTHHHMQHSGKLISSRGKLINRQHPRPVEICDNSNDSGLGFDPLDHNVQRNAAIKFSEHLDSAWNIENIQTKLEKPDLKFESDDANDTFNFPQIAKVPKQLSMLPGCRLNLVGGKLSAAVRRKAVVSQIEEPQEPPPVTLFSQLPSHSKDGSAYLQIVTQPEGQHRARYQTEGSRGAIKDKSGNNFPTVRLIGYSKPTTLQIFIGTDVGKVAPHMFYQACRVYGKNSTPCTEKKVDGTVLIEMEIDPSKNSVVVCDCVGILKERNVDVEHRFGEQTTGQRCKKKSTRCRMIFRTQIKHANGACETLQICSHPISCTQPPGVPEICRKSLVSSPATGGLELFLLGKNFLKDTKIIFKNDQPPWEEHVLPDKEYLQQTHLVCGVPPYALTNIKEPVTVKLFVVSGDKASEPHKFVYTPTNNESYPQHATYHHSVQGVTNGFFGQGELKEESAVTVWDNMASVGMMPPPAVPLRRPSAIPDPHSPLLNDFKAEMDDSSQGSVIDDANDLMIKKKRFRKFSESSIDINDNMQCSDSLDPSLAMMQRSESSNINLGDSSVNILDGNAFSQSSSMIGLSQPMDILNTSRLSPEELKVIDLTMKPGGIVSENDPSLATIHQFVDSHNKLPTQTGQSVENFLSNIDKSMLTQPLDKSYSQQIQTMQHSTDKVMQSVTAAIFDESNNTNMYPSQQTLPNIMMQPVAPIEQLISSKQMQNTLMQNIIADPLNDQQVKSEIFDANGTTQMKTLAFHNGMISSSPPTSAMLTPDLTPTHSDSNQSSPVSRDLMLSAHSSPEIVLNPNASPVNQDLIHNTILNTQVSPTMLCSQDSTLLIPSTLNQTGQDSLILPQSNPSENLSLISSQHMLSPTVKTPPATVKNMILNAAAEIFKSDKAIDVLVTTAINTANIINENVQGQSSLICTQAPSVPVEFQPQSDQPINSSPQYPPTFASQMTTDQFTPQAIVDNAVGNLVSRMEEESNGTSAMSQAVTQVVSQVLSQAITQAVTQEIKTSSVPMQELSSMTDTELLSYINPSCFDQV